MVMARISTEEILQQIESMSRGGPAAECHYASLLQVILFPGIYGVEEADLITVIKALRKEEHNLGALKISCFLNQTISPFPTGPMPPAE